ncbi:hypothetical protein GOBAR_DD34351 [Gossypium barbadense]|nr:hypothetical protein GOBAR_DD34351 [Gossypium barbadense]
MDVDSRVIAQDGCGYQLNDWVDWLEGNLKRVAAEAETPLVSPWRKPKPGFVKINTDGSAIRNPGQAGAGTVIRDHYGNWITGSYGYIPLNYGCCGMALNWHLNKNLDSPTQVPAMDIECHGKERKQFSNFVFLG